MPFDIAALCDRLGSDRIVEPFNEDMSVTELANERFIMRSLSVQDINKIFPNVLLSDTEHVAYIPTRMCHSLPKVNKRGRCFFPSVMKRCAAGAKDNLVNLDHILKKHKQSEDRVIGHICAVAFDPDATWDGRVYEEVANVGIAGSKQSLILPTKAIPLFALMALFRRTEDGNNIIEQLSSGKRRWKTSMECVAFPEKCGFLYDNTFIHAANAPSEMLECVEKERVKPYKGKPLALCLGGIEDTVEFCGVGMTTSPADNDSDCLGLVASSYTQTANAQRSMPIRTMRIGFPEEKREEAIELANAKVEAVLEEQAALIVIGQTAESDGHLHDVLSDGSILPFGGHTHGVESVQLVPGTNPRFTAKTSSNERYMGNSEGPGRYFIHSHLVDISLKGKRKATGTPTDEMSSSGDGDENLTSEDIMGLKERIKALEDRLAANPTAEQIASIRFELGQLRVTEEIASAVDAGIDEKLKSGEYVAKAEVDKQIVAAKTEAETKADAELKKKEAAMKKQQDRLAKITALGVDIEAIEEGQTKNIRENILAIEDDERGDREFDRELSRHKALVQLAKKGDEESKKAAEKTLETQQANTKRPYLIGGGGNGDGKGGNTMTVKVPSHFATRRR